MTTGRINQVANHCLPLPSNSYPQVRHRQNSRGLRTRSPSLPTRHWRHPLHRTPVPSHAGTHFPEGQRQDVHHASASQPHWRASGLAVCIARRRLLTHQEPRGWLCATQGTAPPFGPPPTELRSWLCANKRARRRPLTPPLALALKSSVWLKRSRNPQHCVVVGSTTPQHRHRRERSLCLSPLRSTNRIRHGRSTRGPSHTATR